MMHRHSSHSQLLARMTFAVLCVPLVLAVTPRLVPSEAADSDDPPATKQVATQDVVEEGEAIQQAFSKQIQPLINKYCVRCHNLETMKSGVRVDHLDGTLQDRQLFLWKAVAELVEDEAMPPEDEPQLTAAERRVLAGWVDEALTFARTQKRDKNGSVRRLTVAQYRNTLRDLLGLEDDLTDVLPADGVSKDGFLNNGQTMQLSPLLVEAYFDIAERALDGCIVDEDSKPAIQNFRMDLGQAINPDPCPDKLILGAFNHLLKNDDFMVTELSPAKPFEFEPFRMRTKYRFIEGYQGNATVRGWREYDSIYHAVFACMRGNAGYPKGLPYQVVPEGLLLRPAIPSAEMFQVESTYGPQANFKISLRELPDRGRFRVTVNAAKYDDGLLLDPGAATQTVLLDDALTIKNPANSQTVNIEQGGIYQADVYLKTAGSAVAPDTSKLNEELIGAWSFEGDTVSESGLKKLAGQLVGKAKFVESPFGKGVSVDGKHGAVVFPRDDALNVGTSDFTVAAWIRPHQLRQGGIVCIGGYSWTQGWYLDMPNGKGVLRIETAKAGRQPNGNVQSPAGVIRANQWQHVAAVVRRGDKETRLYVNGYEVAVGTIHPASLDNPQTSLHIGRIQGGKLFKGDIDEVRLYRRALGTAEIAALVEPGKTFAKPPAIDRNKLLQLTLGNRHFTGQLKQPAFLAVRLPAGPLQVSADYAGATSIGRVVLTPLQESSSIVQRFKKFEKRSPRVGVHVGLRRDCGSTLAAVGHPQQVNSLELQDFRFEGAISNFPSPDVEKNNVNYLAGIREIGVRSEYTDGRDMPRLRIRSVEFEGPFYETWPPETHRRIFVESKNEENSPAYANDIIRQFASRAFRRPVTDEEAESFLDVWKRAYAETNDFQQSIKDALLVVLTSPQFLFLIENSKSPQPEPINSYELASKLSYFLWNAPPDEHLIQLAATGKLQQSLDAELTRLTHSPKFRQFTHEFTSQWLSLDKLDVVEVDRKRYPKLTRDAKTQLRQEPIEFLQHLIQHNLPLRHLVESDFIVANEVVASYYGLPDRTESGFEFVSIKHGNAKLGGLLSQAGILAGLSDGRESNPVKRGAWLARKLIAEPPDDPPPNVPALPEDDGAELTLREKLERHRNQEGCAKCHSGIDPWGLPLEEFDAGGLFKTSGKVDPRSTLPDGTNIDSTKRLKSYLANDRIDQVAFSFLKHLATYATGRSLSYNEIEFLKEEGLQLKAEGYRTQDMLRFIVQSELFLEK